MSLLIFAICISDVVFARVSCGIFVARPSNVIDLIHRLSRVEAEDLMDFDLKSASLREDIIGRVDKTAEFSEREDRVIAFPGELARAMKTVSSSV